MFGDFARGYAFGRVARSTRKTYEANWKMWVSWRMCRKRRDLVGRRDGGDGDG